MVGEQWFDAYHRIYVNGQGIVAIVKKQHHDINDLVITDGLYVLLDEVQDPVIWGLLFVLH